MTFEVSIWLQTSNDVITCKQFFIYDCLSFLISPLLTGQTGRSAIMKPVPFPLEERHVEASYALQNVLGHRGSHVNAIPVRMVFIRNIAWRQVKHFVVVSQSVRIDARAALRAHGQGCAVVEE